MQLQINGSEDYLLKYRCFTVAQISSADTKKHHKILNCPVTILSRVRGASIYFHCCAIQIIIDIYENTYTCHVFVAALDERNLLHPKRLPQKLHSPGWKGEDKDAVIAPFGIPPQLQSLISVPFSLKCLVQGVLRELRDS